MKINLSIHIIPTIFILLGVITYLFYEICAPYCAKNICGTTSGGIWMLAPALAIIFGLIGVVWLVSEIL